MIAVTGSLAFDHIMDFPGKFSDHIMPDKIHKLNLSFYLETLARQSGGTAGNISYNLSLFKIPVAVLGVAGKDFDEYNHFLQTSGVNTSNIKIVADDTTASAFIMTDAADNQITGFYPGAAKQADTLSINNLNPQPAFVVIAPDKPAAMVKFFTECQQLHLPYLFDPGMQLPRLTDTQIINGIQGADILIGNDYEIALIRQRIQDQAFLNRVKILITTLGDSGSVIQTAQESIQIDPAKPQTVLDPTGAGDAYRAGFLAGFSKKLDLKVCGQMGSVAACYAVEKYGTTNHTFTIEEFRERYKENFGEELIFS